jgi:hypothetical protein
MPRYRKKPVVIEAMYWTGEAVQFPEAHEFLREGDGQVWMAPTAPGSALYELLIPSPHGELRVRPTDWLIRGIEGELYPCPASVFEATYEAVDDA